MDINMFSQNTENLAKEQLKTIEVEGLTKSFGDVVAVNDISFSVLGGEIFDF
jgi:ABC-type branched-subunit amino acid transport system ATPase component